MAEFSYFAVEQRLAVIGAVLFVAQVAAREAGGWVRRRVAGTAVVSAVEETDKGFVLSAMLGLLALLIAFTFSLAVSRYETRRSLVVDEANAIGTAEMRVQLLDAPHGQQLSQMLRSYAQTRLQFGQAAVVDKPELVRQSEVQRAALQAATLEALVPIRTTPLAPFVGAAINSVLDVGVERETMLAARVPLSVLVALGSYILLTAGILGYALAGPRTSQRPAAITFFALLTLTILLILDLDRAQGGTIRTDQSAMVRLVAGFSSEAGEAVLPARAAGNRR